MNPDVKAFIDLQVEFAEAGIDAGPEAIATLVAGNRLREAIINELADIYQVLRNQL